jgi:DNA-binding transcriptional regulator YiaG
MTMKREHTVIVGHHRVIGEYDAVQLEDGSFAMSSADFGRLRLEAAVAVYQHVESITGDELRFARKAMGLRPLELAALLDVTPEIVSRWETGADPIGRQTQLAVLLYLEHKVRFGQLVPLAPQNDRDSPMRIVAA